MQVGSDNVGAWGFPVCSRECVKLVSFYDLFGLYQWNAQNCPSGFRFETDQSN